MYNHLISEQRYAISILLQNKTQKKQIAKEVGIDRTTLFRELNRNTASHGKYHWKSAQASADFRRKGKPSNRKTKDSVIALVKEKLTQEQWSPKQISGWLATQGIQLSHETIYRWIRKDKQEGGTLHTYCRHQLKHRKRPVGGSIQHIPNRVSITERPKEADGTRFGNWEMDLIVDRQQHVILTLVERSTNMLLMERIRTGKKAVPIAKAAARLLMPYRATIKTITTDNGSEFAAHHLITKGLYMKGKEDVTVYFTDAYSSWQKGCIENTNKLIRKYIPKRANFNRFDDAYIKKIQKKLNRRPREKLNFSTPYECFFKYFS